jgi:hypothetical protein
MITLACSEYCLKPGATTFDLYACPSVCVQEQTIEDCTDQMCVVDCDTTASCTNTTEITVVTEVDCFGACVQVNHTAY